MTLLKAIAFIGYGELAKQLHAFLTNDVTEFICFDDASLKAGNENAFPFQSYADEKFQLYEFIVALGYLHLQKKKAIVDELLGRKRKLFSFVHPSCFVNNAATVKEGSFLYPMCNVDKDASIGAAALLNNSVCISHNTVIGDCCYLSPGVVTSGFVEIGDCTFIGTGSVISDNIKIGKNVTIGPGSVITKDIPDDCSVIGNPARILSRPLNLSRNEA
jgi:sugar O-acyltransferase (sialic acid O-acetyltransferase NeuD family)